MSDATPPAGGFVPFARQGEQIGALDDLGITFGVGTCPPEVRAAVEQQAAAERIARPRPSTSEREAFFAEIAETIKRAGGQPR